MRQMSRAVQHGDARMRDAPCELVRISRRDDAVGFAPDDQGRRGDAVDVFFQAFVGMVMAGQLSWLEQRNHDPCVGGSNPSSATS
jgi:hypothetical protein